MQIDIDSKIIEQTKFKDNGILIFLQRFESFLNAVHAFVERYPMEKQVDLFR